MTDEYPDSATEYVAASYRYLRLANLVLVLMLAASLVIEIHRASCWQGSISAYYYTPVHSVFVAALFAMGITMVALKGKDAAEDLFLNVAGILAPIVALVPTARPKTVCSRPGEDLTIDTRGLVTNNMWAVIVGAVAAILIARLIAVLQHKKVGRIPRSTWVGIGVSSVLLAAGFVWYVKWRDNFGVHAHAPAAIAMFVMIWFAVIVNGRYPASVLERLYRLLGARWNETPPPRVYLQWYRSLAVAMPVVGLVFLVSLLGTWEHRVFWLEAFEIAPFAAFWTVQTFERWTDGIRPDDPQTDRTDQTGEREDVNPLFAEGEHR